MNRIIAAVAAVLILGGAGYFFFLQGPGGGDRVSGEELRSYVETQLGEAGAKFESVAYDSGSDTVTVTSLDLGGVIPVYKDMKIATFKIEGGDKRALEQLFDKEKATQTENAKFLRVAKRLSAENVTFSVDLAAVAGVSMPEAEAEVQKALGGLNGKGTIESFSVEDFAVKPTGEALSDLLGVPDLSSPAALKAYMARVGKLGSAEKFGRTELKGFKYRLDSEETTVDLNMESIASDGYDAGVLGKSEIGPVNMTVGGKGIQDALGGAFTVSVDGAMLERLDMSKMLAAMADGTIIPERPEKAPILETWTPMLGRYKVSGVKVSVPGKGDFTLEEASEQKPQYFAGIGLGGKGNLKNLVIPAAAFSGGGVKQVLDALGADELRINVSWDATIDEKEKTWDVSKLLVDVDKFGSLDLQFRLGGLGFLNDLVGMPADEFKSSGIQQRILQEMTFGRLQLAYRDQGAVDYLLKTMAEKSGAERSQLAQQYVQQFDALRAKFGESPALDQLSTALSTFLQDPKSLTLTFSPEEPVTLADIMATAMATPVQLVEKLGFSAKANQ